MRARAREPRAPRPAAPTPEERALFAAVMRDVTPIRREQHAPVVPAAAEPPKPGPQPAAPSRPVPAPAPAKPAAKAPPVNPGLDRRTAERLRKGEIPIERRIDLHGLTQDDAHAALDRFVRTAWREGKRMLLVITGKGSVSAGGGVLRRHVPRWLAAGEHAARVLRIETAQPRHGGAGACYVLLRRRRDGP